MLLFILLCVSLSNAQFTGPVSFNNRVSPIRGLSSGSSSTGSLRPSAVGSPPQSSPRPSSPSSLPQTGSQGIPDCNCAKIWNPVCVQPPPSPAGQQAKQPLTMPNKCEADCIGFPSTPGECPGGGVKESQKCMYLECTPGAPTGACAFGVSYYDTCMAKCVLKDYALTITPQDIQPGPCPDPCKGNSVCPGNRQCRPRVGQCLDPPCLPYKCVNPACYTAETPCLSRDQDNVCANGVTYTAKCFAECDGASNWKSGPCPLNRRDAIVGQTVVPFQPEPGSAAFYAFNGETPPSSTAYSAPASSGPPSVVTTTSSSSVYTKLSSVSSGSGNGTGCLARRAREQKECGNRVGCKIIQCNEDGTYKSVQCSGSTGFCWCVDAEGNQIPNTSQRGREPECSANVKEQGPLVCVAGLYLSTDGGKEECLPCAPGSFSKEGSTSCKLCDPGYEAPLPASSECLPCRVGFYAPLIGTDRCLACPVGMTSTEGQPFCEDEDKCTTAAKDPCACSDALDGKTCGWSSNAKACITGGSTDCKECPSMLVCLPPTPEPTAKPQIPDDEDAPLPWAGAPSSVRLLKVTGKTQSTLQVQWVPPADRFSCDGDVYVVQYRSGKKGSWKTYQTNGSSYIKEPFSILKNLIPNRYYAIQVTPYRLLPDGTPGAPGTKARVIGKTEEQKMYMGR